MESDKNRLEKEIAEIEEKLNLLLTQPDTAKCPVCQTELGVAGLQHISAHYDTEKLSKSESMKNIVSMISQKKAASKITELEIAQIEKNLAKEKAQTQSAFGVLEKEIGCAEESGSHLADAREELKKIEESLARKDFALAQQQTIDQISAELAAMKYDSTIHEQARQELENLQKYEEPQRRLEEADKLIGQEREDIGRC